GARNSPGSRGSEPSTLALAGVTPVINVLERRASGLWRSGSASHWQCGGRGFESRQLHRQRPALSTEVVPRKVFPSSWTARPFCLGRRANEEGGRHDQRRAKEDRALRARCHRAEVAEALGLVRPPRDAGRRGQAELLLR